MSTEIDEILAELKRIRKELDELKSFDVPRPSGDFVRISGDTMTGALEVNTLALGNQVGITIGSSVGGFIRFADAGLKDWAIGNLDGSSALTFFEGRYSGGAGTEVMRIAAGGNVGIGTTVFGGDGGVAPRLQVANPSNADKYIGIGYDNTGDYGFIHAIHRATAWKNLVLQGFGGNVGIDTTGPTAKFSVSEKCAMNADGGFMVKLTNKTGSNSVKGEVVMAYDASAINNAVAKIVQNEPDPFGVFYESGIADGAEAWIVVSGIADVYFIGNTTRGHIARGFVTADAGYVTGRALSEAIPTSPFATDKHFYEIGHVLESRTGAGLAKCILHFN